MLSYKGKCTSQRIFVIKGVKNQPFRCTSYHSSEFGNKNWQYNSLWVIANQYISWHLQWVRQLGRTIWGEAKSWCKTTCNICSKEYSTAPTMQSPGRTKQDKISGSHFKSQAPNTLVCWNGCCTKKVWSLTHMYRLETPKWEYPVGGASSVKGRWIPSTTLRCNNFQQAWCK